MKPTTKKTDGGLMFGLLGSMLSVTISWSNWHSIIWAIFHGVLGWLYVVYFALKDGRLG
jgi:hypothetical protein